MDDKNLLQKAQRDFAAQGELASLYIKYRELPIDETAILYESYRGIGLVCNPYAIFRAFMDNGDSRYKHIWILDDENELVRTATEYRQYPNVSFVNRSKDAEAFAKHLATAKYQIQNGSLPHFFSKRPGQVLVSTWHGTALKKLGFDSHDKGLTTANANTVRGFLQSDYILSPNRHMTDVFRYSFRLQGAYNGTIIEEGYPRNDLIFRTDKNKLLNKLANRGITIDPAKEIILYAPTWRGATLDTAKNDAEEYLEVRAALAENPDSDRCQVLIKPHQSVYKQLSAEQKQSGAFIPSTIDPTELFSIVDILITDYSSIYFDFLVTERPIIFYIPDLDEYEEERGIYFKPGELPGPQTAHLDELCALLQEIDAVREKYKSAYLRNKAWACEYDDGNVSRRVINIIFNNCVDYNVITCSNKKKMLFYQGVMKTSGLSEVFFTFLESLDYNKLDVTVYCKNDEHLINAVRINDKVRVLVRVGMCVATLEEHYAMYHVFENGFDGKYDKEVNGILATEFSRCFGDAQFDHVIDFSGFGTFFASLMSQAVGAKKYIWQHNDLYHDFNNAEKIALRTQYTSAKALNSIYYRYDKIVSVGEILMKINMERFSNNKFDSKYAYVNNPINIERINKCLESRETPFDAILERPGVKFVNIGRLCPEKNQVNLIRAFARFCEIYPDSSLFIIGPDEYKGELHRLVEQLNLQENVFLTGKTDNPFSIMKKCDCFVFPSFYEGQSIVALEARYLKLPIIISNYSTVASACVPNGQLLIGFEESDIFEGLTAFVNGQVPADYEFDAEGYNRKCFEEFRALFA